MSGMDDLTMEKKALTGTLLFTSIDRVDHPKEGHKKWHDLESIFWISVHIISRHARCYIVKLGLNKSGLELLPTLLDPPNATTRHGFLLMDMQRLHVIDNEPLTKCLRWLGELVSKRYRHIRGGY